MTQHELHKIDELTKNVERLIVRVETLSENDRRVVEKLERLSISFENHLAEAKESEKHKAKLEKVTMWAVPLLTSTAISILGIILAKSGKLV